MLSLDVLDRAVAKSDVDQYSQPWIKSRMKDYFALASFDQDYELASLQNAKVEALGPFTLVVAHSTLPRNSRMHRYFRAVFLGSEFLLRDSNVVDATYFEDFKTLKRNLRYLRRELNKLDLEVDQPTDAKPGPIM